VPIAGAFKSRCGDREDRLAACVDDDRPELPTFFPVEGWPAEPAGDKERVSEFVVCHRLGGFPEVVVVNFVTRTLAVLHDQVELDSFSRITGRSGDSHKSSIAPDARYVPLPDDRASETPDCDDAPDRFDHSKRPCTRHKAVDAGQSASGCERCDEGVGPRFKRVHRHHEGERKNPERSDHTFSRAERSGRCRFRACGGLSLRGPEEVELGVGVNLGMG